MQCTHKSMNLGHMRFCFSLFLAESVVWSSSIRTQVSSISQGIWGSSPVLANQKFPPILIKFKLYLSQELNDEKIYKELDFTDFEETFRLKDYKSSNKMQEKFQRLREKHSKRISLVATDRARNLSKMKVQNKTSSFSQKDRKEIFFFLTLF